MADFSKQYCQKYDQELPWDFNMDTEFDRLEPGQLVPIICEGFGFWGLAKEFDGSLVCLYENSKGETVKVPYSKISNKTYEEVKNNTIK